MRFAADENFNGKILDHLIGRLPDLDIVRIQDTVMYQAPDTAVLAWAAQENRILLTHDVQTLVNDAYLRVKQGQPMPGVILVASTIPIGQALADLEMVIAAGQPHDFESQVIYIPMP